MDLAPGTDLFPCSPTPQTEEAEALTAELRIQFQSCWPYPTGLYSPNGQWLFTCGTGAVWSDVASEPLPGSVPDMWQNHISHEEHDLRSEAGDILALFQLSRLYSIIIMFKQRNTSSYIWVEAMEPSKKSNGFAQHTRPPFSKGSSVDLSHMKENLSHCSIPINQFKSDQSPSTCPLLHWRIYHNYISEDTL